MKQFLCGLAVLPFLAGTALADPVQLGESQMDAVSAGFMFIELDSSNTSATVVVVGGPTLACTGCYLNLSSPNMSISSAFLPRPVTFTISTPS